MYGIFKLKWWLWTKHNIFIYFGVLYIYLGFEILSSGEPNVYILHLQLINVSFNNEDMRVAKTFRCVIQIQI